MDTFTVEISKRTKEYLDKYVKESNDSQIAAFDATSDAFNELKNRGFNIPAPKEDMNLLTPDALIFKALMFFKWAMTLDHDMTVDNVIMAMGMHLYESGIDIVEFDNPKSATSPDDMDMPDINSMSTDDLLDLFNGFDGDENTPED